MNFFPICQHGTFTSIGIDYTNGERPAAVCDYIELEMKSAVIKYSNNRYWNTAIVNISCNRDIKDIVEDLKKNFK